MPGSVRSIILGGGISAGAPATLGNIPQFSGANPPDLLVDSILRQVVGPPAAIIVGTTDPDATATETFRTTGGIFSEGTSTDSTILGRAANVGLVGPSVNDSIAIGNQAKVSGGNVANTVGAASIVLGSRSAVQSNQTPGFQATEHQIVIGTATVLGNTLGGTATNNIVIGNAITGQAINNAVIIAAFLGAAPPSQLGDCVVVGTNTRIDAGGFGSILIGTGARIVGGGSNVVIGRGAIKNGATGDSNVIIGELASGVGTPSFVVVIGSGATANNTGNIAIGRATNITHANAGVIGPGATSERANSFVIGSDNTGGDYRTYVFGNRGDTVGSGIQDVLWRPTDADGATSNMVGSGLTVRAGLSSGNAASAVLNLDVGIVGASGATVQTPRTGARVSYSATALDTYLMVFDVDNNTLERVSVGAADSGGVGFKVLRIPN